MFTLQSIFVPLGILALLSFSAAYYYRFHLIAGAFWFLISLLLLTQWGLIFGAIGCVVGASHLILLGRETHIRKHRKEAA